MARILFCNSLIIRACSAGVAFFSASAKALSSGDGGEVWAATTVAANTDSRNREISFEISLVMHDDCIGRCGQSARSKVEVFLL